MKFVFIADEIKDLSPKGDTSLLLVRAAKTRGHEVYWATREGISLCDTKIRLEVFPIIESKPAALPTLGDSTHLSIESFDAAFIRKDPPFDADYVKLCWLLSLAESQTFFFNHPALLLRYHEKLVPIEAVIQGYLEKGDIIPSFYRSLDVYLKNTQSEAHVSKPFFGYGGRAIRKWDSKESLRENLDAEEEVVQPFSAEVYKQGDRRVFFLGGKYLGGVVRMPTHGNFVSNLAQGGEAQQQPLSDGQKQVIERLEKFLSAQGIDFAGADLIGEKFTEVNITSPTGLVSMEALDSVDYGAKVIKFIEDKTK